MRAARVPAQRRGRRARGPTARQGAPAPPRAAPARRPRGSVAPRPTAPHSAVTGAEDSEKWRGGGAGLRGVAGILATAVRKEVTSCSGLCPARAHRQGEH